jgi:hypothetical protein
MTMDQTTKLPCVHGGRGEALTRVEEMEEEMDKGKKEEALDPIMMEEDQRGRGSPWAVEKIEEILHTTYERKTRGPRVGT